MHTKMIEFARPDGKKAPGYLELPAAGTSAPAVVVIEEWWGLNDQIKGVADRLAKAGYRALVPDLFRGKVTKDRDEASHMASQLNWDDAVGQDVRGAVQHLKSFAPAKVGVIGFCVGGALAIVAGVKVAELDAGLCFYGCPPPTAADPGQLRIPMQFHFATRDDWCNAKVVDNLERDLARAHVTHELYRYQAAHAFMNDARPEVYAPDAAKLAWQRTFAFLERHLAG